MYRALKVPKTQTPPRLSHYSPMLHNAILALGTAFSNVPTIRDLKTRLYFLEKAKSYIEDECSRPHISVVNALSLIASFYSSQSDQTLGFVYFGKHLSIVVPFVKLNVFLGMSARVGQACKSFWLLFLIFFSFIDVYSGTESRLWVVGRDRYHRRGSSG
jgi:hypothetical protein